MYDKPKPFYFLVILIALFSFRVSAQVDVNYRNVINQIKDGHTHILGFAPLLSNEDAFLDIFQKYWTITKGIDFIAGNKLPDKLVSGDSYFIITDETDPNFRGREAVDAAVGLWVPRNKISGKHTGFTDTTLHQVACITLTQNLRFKGRGPNAAISNSIGYWSRGNMKNFLQELSAAILSGKKVDASDDITDKAQLKLLQNQILYCSPDVFYQLNDTGDKTKFVKDVFQYYPSNYSVISTDELSAKILADKEPFYYLIYLHNHVAGNVVAIMNSSTGQLIYSRTKSSFTDQIRPEYLKDIFKGIN